MYAKSPRRIAHALLLSLPAVGLADAAAGGPATSPATVPATAPATVPADPDPRDVARLDDAALVELCHRVYPEPGSVGGIWGTDAERLLRQAVGDEVGRRGKRYLAVRLAADPPPEPAKLSDAALDLLLRAAGDGRPRRRPDDARDADAAGRRFRDRVEPAVREGLRRGGRLARLTAAVWTFPDLSSATDAELRAILDPNPMPGRGGNEERALCEVVRRGGPGWAAFLADLIAARRRVAADGADRFDRLADRPEPLTALRRVQGKADPLVVEVDGPQSIDCEFPSLPDLAVAVVNRDPHREPVVVQRGGDYRSGRQVRWRFDVRDAGGRPTPVRPALGDGGGFLRHEPLAPGERYEQRLAMGSFVPALPPGAYTFRVLFHNRVGIADEEGVDGLIVSTSAPLRLTVRPLAVDAAAVADAARRVPELLAAIPVDDKLKVPAGTYGEWAHALVPPDSAQGKLLALGLPAVPPLLDALADPKLTPRRRAVVLSLLFSLTGQNDPRMAGPLLGGFEAVDGPWAIGGAEQAAFGWGLADMADGPIDEKAQREWAGRWAPWRGYLRLVPAAPATAPAAVGPTTAAPAGR